MTDRDAQESFIRKGAEAMTEEELKYLTALQPEIRKRIGDWRLGDIGYFDSKIGQYRSTGDVHGSGIKEHRPMAFETPLSNFYCKLDEPLFIPHPMPMPGVPTERTLWGWINWEESVASIASNGFLIVQKYPWIKGNFICCESPYLALLKTLVHQWNVKVK